MTANAIRVDEARLVQMATSAADQIKKSSLGKPEEALTQTTAGTFNAIAAMLDALAARMNDRSNHQRKLQNALQRIANLEIRSAAELLERSDWKKIAAELQAIAEQALQPIKVP